MLLPGDRSGRAAPDGEPPDGLLDALDGRPGPARSLAPAAAAQMVRSVLAQALDAPAAPLLAGPAVPHVASRAAPAWRVRVPLAAAVLLGLGVASGASALAIRILHLDLGRRTSPKPAPPRAPPPPTRAAEAEPIRPIVAEPEVSMVEVPALREAPPPRRRAPRVAIVSPAPAPVVVPENLPPADLLAAANERRARRAWREADAYYAAVVARFGGTDAAVIAEVASASLHLQHLGDARGALAAFRRTLQARPTGAVAEEARWGVAEAQREIGDRDAEALALREFLDRYPQSALAAAARRRLERLAP